MKKQIRKLSPELSEIAKKNCNENSETIQSNIEALQTWFRKSPYLKARNDEQLLLAFLRRCQFSLEETKRRIDCYYSLKSVFPDVLCERLVNESLLDFYRSGIYIIPTKCISSNSSRVLVCQFSKCDQKKRHVREAFKLLFMLLEIMAIEDDNTSVAGVSCVIDARDVSVEQMLQYDPFLLKKTWTLVDRGLPLKFVEIHFINTRREGQAIFNVVSSLLPAKMPFKFMVHKKAEDLYEHIPRDVMPIEYGGHNGYNEEALEFWEKKLQMYSEYFANDANYGTNEQLRIGVNKTLETSELSGLNGSFRKLDID